MASSASAANMGTVARNDIRDRYRPASGENRPSLTSSGVLLGNSSSITTNLSGNLAFSETVPPTENEMVETASPAPLAFGFRQNTDSLPLLRETKRSVDATVGEMNDKFVIFYLDDTDHERRSIRLPRDIVPDEVLAYGAPVEISLKSRSGVRYPLIRRRSIAPSTEADASLEEWFASH